jgi:general secretion pathway protein H
MRMSAAGNSLSKRGFTLVELLVVIAIIAMASAGVSFAIRDSSQTVLEREAERLAALLESGRAQSRTNGVAIRWRALEQGFRFEGSVPGTLPDNWMSSDIVVPAQSSLLLGPEPIIGPQRLVLRVASQPQTALMVATDGVRPFSVQAVLVSP